MWGATDLA
jgi:hypothetical protein